MFYDTLNTALSTDCKVFEQTFIYGEDMAFKNKAGSHPKDFVHPKLLVQSDVWRGWNLHGIFGISRTKPLFYTAVQHIQREPRAYRSVRGSFKTSWYSTRRHHLSSLSARRSVSISSSSVRLCYHDMFYQLPVQRESPRQTFWTTTSYFEVCLFPPAIQRNDFLYWCCVYAYSRT